MEELKEKITTKLSDNNDKPYEIILHNDDINSFDHVIDCLVKHCKHSLGQAEQCAILVHYKGKCSIKEGDLDTLLSINNSLLREKLTSEIQKK